VSSIGSGPEVGAVIKANLAPLGLDVKIVPKAPKVLRDWLQNPNNPWDLATLHGNPEFVDPMAFINFGLEGHHYDSVSAACPCFYNYSGFEDKKWVKRMRRTDNQRQGRLKAYALLDRDLMSGPVPIAPYATGNSLTLVSPQIGCIESSPYPVHLSPNLAALCLR
jgi:hypothetical protein